MGRFNYLGVYALTTCGIHTCQDTRYPCISSKLYPPYWTIKHFHTFPDSYWAWRHNNWSTGFFSAHISTSQGWPISHIPNRVTARDQNHEEKYICPSRSLLIPFVPPNPSHPSHLIHALNQRKPKSYNLIYLLFQNYPCRQCQKPSWEKSTRGVSLRKFRIHITPLGGIASHLSSRHRHLRMRRIMFGEMGMEMGESLRLCLLRELRMMGFVSFNLSGHWVMDTRRRFEAIARSMIRKLLPGYCEQQIMR